MEHRMKLHEQPFRAIMQGRKNIELRLFDGKRQQLKTGDTIVFTLVDSEEKISAKISALYRADSFAALFDRISPYDCGFGPEIGAERAAGEMRKIYPEEKEKQYGVIGIELSEVYWKTRWLSEDEPVLKYTHSENWKRMFNFDWCTRDFFTITTARLIIIITGGSVKFYDKATESLLHTNKGFQYLYTGDVNAAETELMALENGKHFYIFSLEDFSQTKRVTLPRGFEASDVCGKYSKDGSSLYIPVHKYNDEEKRYDDRICRYETDNYTLTGMEAVSMEEIFDNWRW